MNEDVVRLERFQFHGLLIERYIYIYIGYSSINIIAYSLEIIIYSRINLEWKRGMINNDWTLIWNDFRIKLINNTIVYSDITIQDFEVTKVP